MHSSAPLKCFVPIISLAWIDSRPGQSFISSNAAICKAHFGRGSHYATNTGGGGMNAPPLLPLRPCLALRTAQKSNILMIFTFLRCLATKTGYLKRFWISIQWNLVIFGGFGVFLSQKGPIFGRGWRWSSWWGSKYITSMQTFRCSEIWSFEEMGVLYGWP